MKAEYNSLIYAFESNQSDIMNILSDEIAIATEAETKPAELDAATAVKDTVKSDEAKSGSKTVLINKVIEKVKELIKKIGAMFEGLKRKLTNRLRIMSQTDKGFANLYNKRKSMIKPYKNVRIISYQYNNKILEDTIQNILKETLICFDKLRVIKGTTNNNARISEILDTSNGKIVEVLLQPYTKDADTPMNTVPLFIRYIVDKYRGEKKELVYVDTQLSQIESNALSTQAIANRCNGYLREAQEAYNKLKSLEYQINRTSTDPEVTKLVASNAAKAATLYNAFTALINAYYELKLEQSLNYRIILKKFYQF